MSKTPLYVTVREAATLAGLTPQGVRWHLSTGRVRGRKLKDGTWRVLRSSVVTL